LFATRGVSLFKKKSWSKYGRVKAEERQGGTSVQPIYVILSILLAAMLSYDIAKFVRGERPDWKEAIVTVLVFVGFLAALQMAFDVV
jgi:hypothetical protein